MQPYQRLFKYAWRQKRLFLLILALTLAASALGAAQPWPMKMLLDNILQSAPLPEALSAPLRACGLEPTPGLLLGLVVAGGLALFALTNVLEIGLTLAWTIAGRRTVYDLAEEMYARLQRRSLLFHSRTPVGDTLSRVTGDSWCVHHIAENLFFNPLHAVLSIAFMLFLMAQVDAGLTWIACLLAPAMVAASFLLGKPLRAVAKERREIESGLQTHLQQALTGVPVVQAFAQEEREQRRFQEFADAAIRAQQRGTLLGSINSLGSGLIATLGVAAILWFGGQHVIQGTLKIGGLMAFVYYLNSLHVQIKNLANIYTALQGLHASVQRVTAVLTGPPEIKDSPGAIALPPVRGRVEFEKVTFGYDPDVPVLRQVSLQAQPGQTVAIVGATGAGKTSLVRLIPRFADPWEGSVLVDGRDIRGVQLRSLRAQISLVLQEPFLFPLTIAENIAYGKPGAAAKEIETAARAANAHLFIDKLPQGYQTVLGERGATLSGGERQRLSIARALLKNAPILILDEPTSALDAETEHLVMQALERLMEGRTTFIIAHRLSSVRRADCILVLENGRILERGSHDELLAGSGPYARLHQAQFSIPNPGGS